MSRFYLAVEDAFTGEECDAAIALAADAAMAPGPLYGGCGEMQVDRTRRDVRALLVERGEAPWLFARLDELFARAAGQFAIPVGPVSEPIQILRYEIGGHFAMWHTDGGVEAAERRLISISVELSALADHEGGALEIVPDLVGRPRALERGGTHLFPSRALHRVMPVTRGTRWAVVAWAGPPEG